MARFRSWIDLERLRTLVEETAWRPSEPSPHEQSWGDSGDGQPGRRRPRFFAPDEYFEHEVPPSRRRTEHPPEPPAPPRGDVDEGRRFEPRRRRRWTGVIDDDATRDGWAEEEADVAEPPRRGNALRVEPPPEPRVPFSRAEPPTQPRQERRAPRVNRSVEPPPEPRVRSSVPPPPSFSPGVHYDPPRAGTLEDRLAHLLDWATDVSGSDVAFVADHEGLLLARRHASDVEEAVAAVLEGFLEQLVPFLGDAVEGHVTLRSYGRVFVVTWHETGVGRFFLGIVGASPPPPSVVPELASALASTVADVGEIASRPRSPTPISMPMRMPGWPSMGTPAPVADNETPPPMAVPIEPARFEPPAAAPPMPVAAPPPMPVVAPPPMPVVAPPAPIVAAPLPEAAPVPAAIEEAATPEPEPEIPDPTPPPEVAPSRARRLLAAITTSLDPRTVKLRVSLQTGLSVAALGDPDGLSDAELDAIGVSLHRILGLDPAKI